MNGHRFCRQWLRGAAVALFAAVLWGQERPPVPAFEVADLKLNVDAQGPPAALISNGSERIRNVALRPLIAAAWSLPLDGVKGPGWLDDVHVDLVAKAAKPGTPEADLRVMMRAVLRERMEMVARVEQREESVWALTVWKGQPKMAPSEMPAKPEDAKCGPSGDGANGVRMVCRRETMASLARILSQMGGWEADKRVVDQTGLQGAFDFALQWTPPGQTDNGGLTLFDALEAQLGLRLESRKVAVPVVVVESMERAPIDN